MPELVLEIIHEAPLLLEILPGVGPRGPAGTGGSGGGEDGLSAYEVWLNAGHEGTEAEFLNWLKGAPGNDGAAGNPGAAGASAYQVWLAAGHAGTEADFLAWLKGAPGDPGTAGTPGNPGAAGASAYQVWLAAGHTGTEAEFLDWLKGAPGGDGAAGPAGPGLPVGGTVGQIPTKLSAADYDTGWKNPPKGAHYPLAFPSLYVVGASVDQSVNASGATTVTMTANSIDWTPFLPVNDLKIAEIGVYVSTAVAGNIEVGIYEDNGDGALAGAALVRSTVLSSATTGLKSFVIPDGFTFQGGKAYWLAVGVTAACAMYALPVAAMMPLYIQTTTGSRSNLRRTTTTGVLPANGSGISAPFASASTPQVRMKLSA